MSNLVVPDQTPCGFCEQAAGRPKPSHGPPAMVWEDELVKCFLNPSAQGGIPGHALVVPTRHVETIFDCTDQEITSIALVVKRVALAIRRVYDPPGLVLRQNNGVAGWQSVPHVHVHVVPKTAEASLLEQLPITLNDIRQEQAAALRAAWPAGEEAPLSTVAVRP